MKSNRIGSALGKGLIAIIALIFVDGLVRGNFWYTESDVLRALQVNHPQVEEVLVTEWNIWDYSVIIVREGGENKTYFLNTNISRKYSFHNNPDD